MYPFSVENASFSFRFGHSHINDGKWSSLLLETLATVETYENGYVWTGP